MSCGESSPSGDPCVSTVPDHGEDHISLTVDPNLVKLWGRTPTGQSYIEIRNVQHVQGKIEQEAHQ